MGVATKIGPLGPRAIARFYRTRDLDVTVEGLEYLPRHGGALLAARHYHHLYDGAALIDALPRKPKIFVALDWAATPRVRAAMELACRLAGWPMALRASGFEDDAKMRAYDRREVLGYVRRAVADGADLLRDGKLLVVFPEGTPTLDVGGARAKSSDDAILPFHEGFLSMVALAQRDTASRSRRARRGPVRVPIIPVGLSYETLDEGRKRFRVTVRLGAPRYYDASRDARVPLVAEIAAVVRELSLGDGEVATDTFTQPLGAFLARELESTRDALSGTRDERRTARADAYRALRVTHARLTTARDAMRAVQMRRLHEVKGHLERSRGSTPT